MTTLKLVYNGNGEFKANSKFDKGVCLNSYRQGEIITYTDIKPRSHQHLKWWHMVVKKAWDNLPEHLVTRWPSPEHFRKAVLCMVGHCDILSHVYKSEKDAINAALSARFGDDYLIVAIDKTALTIMRAKSQSYKHQGQTDFREVVDAALQEMSGILGCDPVSLLDDIYGIPNWVSEPYKVAA